MSAEFSQNGRPDTSPIHRLIETTRKLLRGSWVATGAGLTLGLLLGTALAAAFVDLVVPLPWTLLRFVFLLAVVVPTAWVCVVGVVRPLLRRLRPVTVARKIESHLPGIHNRLVSCVDLDVAGEARQKQVSPAFHRRLVEEALARIKSFTPKTVVDFLSLRRAGVFAGASTLALIVALIFLHDRLPTALARILLPFSDIPPASGVVYRIESPGDPIAPGDAKVLREEDVIFDVQVEKGTPEGLTLVMWDDETGEPVNHELKAGDGGLWSFTLIGQEKSFSYRVYGGRTWTRLHHVTIVERPRIVELHTLLHYPAYMGISEPRVGPPQVPDVTGPVESQVEVVVRVEGEAVEGEIQLLQPEVRATEFAEADRPERPWLAGKLPAGVNDVGTWEWVTGPDGRLSHTEPPAAGEHQHYFGGDPQGIDVAPTEGLYTWVYVDPQAPPQTIMLRWHDGENWEHKAYWGAEPPAAAGSQPRNMGALPEAGKWTRLVVPAAEIDLERKTLRGMGFALWDGRCYWGAAGVLGPTRVEREELATVATAPLAPGEDGRWTGRFTIEENGFYRVEVRNILSGAGGPKRVPNKQMKEGKIVAIPDNPPQIAIERPASDVTMTEPVKLPLTIAAYDDFGLAQVLLQVQRGDSGGFTEQVLRTYAKAERSHSLVAALDVPAFNLQPGEHVRYRAEVLDHKGQRTATQEYLVRIASDENAADQRLARFEEAQETFEEKLARLISEQQKVTEQVEALEAKYEPLAEKIEQAEAERQQAEEERPATTPAPDQPAPAEPAPQPEPLKLDPETQKLLDELRNQLSELAKQEQANAQLSQEIQADVAEMAQEAGEQQLLPQPVIEEIQALEQGFQEMAVDPLAELTADIQASAQPDPANAPDLEELGEEAQAVQQNLEALQERMEALAEAAEQTQADPEAAVAELDRELMRQEAGLSARELAALQEFLAAQLEALEQLQSEEEQVVEAAETVPESVLEDIEEKQDEIEAEAEEELADVRELQATARPEMMRSREPEFPDAPYVPEGDEELLPPEEEDTFEPAEEDPAAAEDAEGEAAEEESGAEDAEAEEEEELFMPALGGPRPKLDPRFADKLRPVPQPEEEGADEEGQAEPGEPEDGPPEEGAEEGQTAEDDPAAERRQELGERGEEVLADLDLAAQSIASDQDALEALMERLAQALDIGQPRPAPAQGEQEAEIGEEDEGEAGEDEQGQPEGGEAQAEGQPSRPGRPSRPGQSGEAGEQDQGEERPLSPELAAQLAELMQLPEMREALMMAARMRQMREGEAQDAPQQQPTAPPPPGTLASRGNLRGGPGPRADSEVLAELDIETRTVIMKLQPRVREELLQGMREQGPEGYRAFIQDYFERLTKVKAE
jgi:hypothetical protein